MRSEASSPAISLASWLIVAAMACGCLLACKGLGFAIDFARAVAPGLGLAVLIGAALLGRATGRSRLAAGATAFLQITLFTIVGVVLAYALAARAGPMWDTRLAAADARLGLRWPALWRAADRVPALLWIAMLAYRSLVAQMVICVVALSAAGRFRTLQIAMAAAILGGAVTIALSGVVPARGNLLNPAGYRHLWPSVAWQERGLIAGLRDGSARVLDLSNLQGIVSFPSYHATLTLVLAWALRDVPALRVAAACWATLTVLATPLFGGHYGVDVLAGAGIAIASCAAVHGLANRAWSPAFRVDMAGAVARSTP